MNSTSLSQTGFTRWMAFKPDSEGVLLSALPATPGVFVLRRRRPCVHLRRQSDIAYIGVGANRNGLRARIQQCFHPGPTQTTNQRILAAIGESDGYEVGWRECSDEGAAQKTKHDLLDWYQRDYGELPPLCRRR